jgi:hypothetical protein
MSTNNFESYARLNRKVSAFKLKQKAAHRANAPTKPDHKATWQDILDRFNGADDLCPDHAPGPCPSDCPNFHPEDAPDDEASLWSRCIQAVNAGKP